MNISRMEKDFELRGFFVHRYFMSTIDLSQRNQKRFFHRSSSLNNQIVGV